MIKQIIISNGKASNREHPKTVLNEKGLLVRNTEEVLKAWQKQFTNLLKPVGTKLRANYANDSGTYDEALSRPISMDEVQCAIYSTAPRR